MQWSGCSDNVDFGITFSRNFVDARDRRKSRKNPNKAQPFMNLHNNEAGRKVCNWLFYFHGEKSLFLQQIIFSVVVLILYTKMMISRRKYDGTKKCKLKT